MSSLVVILAATLAGGAIGYAAFWVRKDWDLFVHDSPWRVVLIHLSVAGESVFRGTLAGLLTGAILVVIAESLPW